MLAPTRQLVRRVAAHAVRPHARTLMHVLGIESSCDDTSVAVVRSDRTILSHASVSQWQVHEKWGGIVPHLAALSHRRSMRPMIEKALKDSGLSWSQLDGIAVAAGPGLASCLRVGTEIANGLSIATGKPLYPVNHLEAHLLTARLAQAEASNEASFSPPSFPFLGVLVTGGNTQILVCNGLCSYELLGTSLDDAIGEAYDKTARMLGIPFASAGGPAVERLAAMGVPGAVSFTVPMRHHETNDMSFSGLKTAVAKYVASADMSNTQTRADIALAFQNAAVAHVVDKVSRAFSLLDPTQRDAIRDIVLCGGVSCNRGLREAMLRVCEQFGRRLVLTPPSLCTDNGVMIAWTGIEHAQAGIASVPYCIADAHLPLNTHPALLLERPSDAS